MISTPETGVDSIAVTYALLDPVMTVMRPVAAFITASVTGLLVNLFDSEPAPDPQKLATPGPGTLLPMATVAPVGDNTAERGCCSTEHYDQTQPPLARMWDKLRRGMSFSFGTLLTEIGPWLMLGILLAALITLFLSPQFIESYLGDGVFSMLIMIGLATPLYVCATASTPIAAALALKGLSPGAALVFLMAGPATNMATITVVARLLGRKTAAIYVISIVICSLGLGLAVNWLYFGLGLSITGWVSGEHQHTHGMIYVISAIILLLLIVKPWIVKIYAWFFPRSESTPVDHHGCSCKH